MSKTKATSLTAGVISLPTKGEAAVSQEMQKTAPMQTNTAIENATAEPIPQPPVKAPKSTEPEEVSMQSKNTPAVIKSITVKVSGTTYKKLKQHGFDLDGKTNQDIFTEALELYFKKYAIK